MIRHRSDTLTAWALLSPARLVLGVFGIFPIGYAFFVSLHRWRIKKEAVVGLRHYAKALGDPVWLLSLAVGFGLLLVGRIIHTRGAGTGQRLVGSAILLFGVLFGARGFVGIYQTGDPRLFNGFKVTLFYACGTIPFEVVGALLLAYLLFRAQRGKGVFDKSITVRILSVGSGLYDTIPVSFCHQGYPTL